MPFSQWPWKPFARRPASISICTIRLNGPNANKLYRQKNVPCSPSDFQKLIDAGVETLYVPSEMARAYRDYLKQQVSAQRKYSGC